MEKSDFINISLDLQRLSFNLADSLDTLNYHSMGEAVEDLGNGVYQTGALMRKNIKLLSVNMDRISALFPDADAPDLGEELSLMYSILDILRRCTGEAKNYRDFLDSLHELLELCDRWGETDPLSAFGATY